MNTFAFLLALAALLSFVLAAGWHGVVKWNWVAIGLALLATAWILQSILVTGSKVTLS